MNDTQIIELFWERSEDALTETKNNYATYLRAIAMNILQNKEDCEECVNDTYFSAWNQIPPDRPNSLSAYLGRVVRCAAIDLYRKNKTRKMYNGMTVLLSELEECVADIPDTSFTSDNDDIIPAINNWLRSLETEKRVLFVRRYWYGQSLNTLATDFGMSQSKLASMMLRLRNNLREYLKGEDIFI